MKTKTTLILGGLGAVLLFVSANVAHTALRAAAYPGYWRGRMREPIPAHAIRLVALGDSTVETIGADRPLDGYVGRIAGYIAARTGRPVHIVNVSNGGATRDIIRDQLPRWTYGRPASSSWPTIMTCGNGSRSIGIARN